jgi:hypothetical protein
LGKRVFLKNFNFLAKGRFCCGGGPKKTVICQDISAISQDIGPKIEA